MLKPGTLIDWKWHETLEGKEAFSSFFYHRGPHAASPPSALNPSLTYQKRRVFGLLERPLLPPSVNAQVRQPALLRSDFEFSALYFDIC